jgi:hypothetical protein
MTLQPNEQVKERKNRHEFAFGLKQKVVWDAWKPNLTKTSQPVHDAGRGDPKSNNKIKATQGKMCIQACDPMQAQKRPSPRLREVS